MTRLNRRQFLGAAIATTGVISTGAVAIRNLPKSDEESIAPGRIVRGSITATSKVPLGKSGLRVSLVGLGTGSIGYAHRSNQTQLGQETFTQLMRHAFDKGINFFDLADSYGSHSFFSEAMKGIPRDRYIVQTKTDNRDPKGAREDIDRFLRELHTEYIDSLIIHCVTRADWTTRYRGVMDALAEAKERGKIRTHGVTCHNFGALQAAAACDWVQINQVRWNPRASHMDADVATARRLFHQMRAKGQGMIGMKVVGQGDIIEGRGALSPNECFRFQIESGVVDAFVVGVEAIEHVDQLLHGTEVALNELGYRMVA
jgi:predicted aldo/keto reductase-like oxidoreductase